MMGHWQIVQTQIRHSRTRRLIRVCTVQGSLNILLSFFRTRSPFFTAEVHFLSASFVCVEVLWPSQLNGVMSSSVGLPNHTFTGQAKSATRLPSIVHILSPETDNCPS